jgi:hypothetical protein
MSIITQIRMHRMAIEHYPVRLVSQTKGEAEGLFLLDEEKDGGLVSLKLQYPGGEVTGHAPDYFGALCQIRVELEAAGWRPLCYGGSRNVYPSGMCRDMGRGLKAYKLQLGRPAALTDLVQIFDTGPDVEPSSVEEQKQFWQAWLQNRGVRA